MKHLMCSVADGVAITQNRTSRLTESGDSRSEASQVDPPAILIPVHVDPTILMGRVAYLDEALTVLIVSALTSTRASYDNLLDNGLKNSPVGTRLRMATAVLKEHGWADEYPHFMDDVRRLFAARNVYARTRGGYTPVPTALGGTGSTGVEGEGSSTWPSLRPK